MTIPAFSLAALSLPIAKAEDADVWNTCIVCGFPREGRGVVYEHHVGTPVEFVVRVRDGGATVWHGLHAKCWARNGGPALPPAPEGG